MDLATLRALVQTDLPDAALQVLLQAAQADVDGALGSAKVTESGIVHGNLFRLAYPAAEVLQVTEQWSTTIDPKAVDPTGYLVRPSGQVLERVHHLFGWRGRVQVTYMRRSDARTRDRVITQLVRLDIHHQPGLASAKFGSWEESYQQGAATYNDERDALLQSLFEEDGMLV